MIHFFLFFDKSSVSCYDDSVTSVLRLAKRGTGQSAMPTAVYRLAEKNIAVTSVHPAVQEYCRDYRTEAVPDFSVITTEADIASEREKSAREDQAEGHAVRPFSDGYLEILAVYRKIAERMPDFDTLLFHGSAVAVDGAAYLFAAVSGTGKSTHTRLWRKMLGARAVMINDDKPLMRIGADGSAIVFGTPWNGKHRLSSNIGVPLRALCLLERAAENSIREITRAEALPMLVQQTYRPADPAALAKTLTLITRLNVKFYRLCCNMEPQAAELSYRAMSQNDMEKAGGRSHHTMSQDKEV